MTNIYQTGVAERIISCSWKKHFCLRGSRWETLLKEAIKLAMFHNLNPRAEESTKNQKAVHKVEGKVYPQKQTKKDEPALLSLY